MIHALALVQEGCEIGPLTKVWQFASVIRGARVGASCTIGACSIVDGSRIGAMARIGHGAQVHPGVVAGDDLFLGPGAIICNDRWPWMDPADFDLAGLIEGRKLAVIIEDGVTIGAGAVILPGARLQKGCVVAAGAVVEARIVPPGYVHMRDGSMAFRRDPAERMRFAA